MRGRGDWRVLWGRRERRGSEGRRQSSGGVDICARGFGLRYNRGDFSLVCRLMVGNFN